MNIALSIAGSDSSGGAGIQADIKTMTALGVYAETAITALTAQNTTGVKSIMEVTETFLRDQLDCVFTDIRPDAVKTGMIPNERLMETVADSLSYYQAKNIVIDPVMVATSGSKLMEDTAVMTMKNRLIKLGTLVTPNIPEAEVLSGMNIFGPEDMEKAAQRIYEETGTAVLLKGGHGTCDAADYLYQGPGKGSWYHAERISNPNTHGTGCTLSSAVGAYLAQGKSLEAAVEAAKEYLTGAIQDGLNLGKGSGPLNHMYRM